MIGKGREESTARDERRERELQGNVQAAQTQNSNGTEDVLQQQACRSQIRAKGRAGGSGYLEGNESKALTAWNVRGGQEELRNLIGGVILDDGNSLHLDQ